MNSQDFRSLQEAYMEVVMGEGKVAWDDKKNPNPSGLTPKEKSDAKRKQLGVDNPDNSSFEKGGPGEKEYARHGNLAAAQDKMSKRSTQPKGKPHEFKKSYLGKRTRGQYNRLFGAKVPKDKRSSYEPEKKNKNSPSFAESFYSENYDIYDIILSHLLDEGYAETPQAAEAIMVNMSEEWREGILSEAILEYQPFKDKRKRVKSKVKKLESQKSEDPKDLGFRNARLQKRIDSMKTVLGKKNKEITSTSQQKSYDSMAKGGFKHHDDPQSKYYIK